MKYRIQAKTRSSKEYVQQIDETHFIIAVRQAPVDGAANEAIIRALADHLDVAPTSLQLIKGHTAHIKIIESIV